MLLIANYVPWGMGTNPDLPTYVCVGRGCTGTCFTPRISIYLSELFHKFSLTIHESMLDVLKCNYL